MSGRSIIGYSIATTLILALLCLATVGQAQMGDTAAKTNAARLTQPWSKMTTLTSEQVNQIADVHRKTLAEVRALEEKERADIIALLSDEQKMELNKIQNQSKTKTTEKKDDGAMP